MQVVLWQPQTRSGGRFHPDAAPPRLARFSRTGLLVGASLLVYAAAPAPAWAVNECGPPPPGGGTVTCTPAGNDYPNGIDYDPPGGLVADLTVVLEPGVVVRNNGSPTSPNGVEMGSNAPGVDLSLQGPVNVDIRTNAVGHDGVDVVAANGSASVAIGEVNTFADNSRGIVVNGFGTVTVTALSSQTQGDFSDGIRAGEGVFGLPGSPPTSGGTSVTAANVNTAGEHSIGINAFSENGDVVIDTGIVTTSGDFSRGILAFSAVDGVHVTSDSVTTSGTSSIGIDAAIFPLPTDVVAGTVRVDSDRVITTGAGAHGIVARSPVSDVTVNSQTISTSGDDARGISAFITSQYTGEVDGLPQYAFGEGDIVVNSDSIATAGVDSEGILAVGTDDITITSSAIATEGDRSGGIYALAHLSGDIVIDSGSVVTRGDSSDTEYGGAHGIEAVANLGSINITSDNVVTSGAAAIGIVARSGENRLPTPPIITTAAPVAAAPDISITSGLVVTEGDDSAGIAASAVDGDIYIDSAQINTSGDRSPGILAQTKYGGITIVSDNIQTTGDESGGIVALVTGGPFGKYGDGGPIVVTSGSIDIRGGGVPAPPTAGISATGPADVTVNSDILIASGDAVSGIVALSHHGDVRVTSDQLSTHGGYSAGILATSLEGNVTVTNTGQVATDGNSSTGIGALAASDGDVTVVSAVVDTEGAASGGIAAASGYGNIGITSDSVVTRGHYADGIFAVTSSTELDEEAAEPLDGIVDITSNSVVTSGDGSRGISAYGASVVVHSTSVTTAGFNSDGIYARSFGNRPAAGGGADLAGAVTVEAVAPGGTSVTSGSVTTTGDDSPGIYAVSDTGDTEVISTGTVATGGDDSDGIIAAGATVTVTSAVVTTTGAGSSGILASSFGTDGGGGGDGGGGSDALSLVPIASDLLTVEAVGPGGTSVTSGSVTTTGDGSPGIEAHSAYGDTEVISTGTVSTSGADSPGILADSATGFVTVDANAVNASGAGSDAIRIDSATGSDVTLRGLVQSAQALALQADGGPATVDIVATGTLRGRIDLTEGDDSLANGGTFDAIGTSQFGAGADVFNNNAGATLRSVNGAAALAGLETFTNRALIDMRDGAANDTLSLSGAFSGQAGSRLGVDVNFDSGTADVLILGPATGTTAIDIQASGSLFSLDNDGILVVDASAGTGAGAFTLANTGLGNAYVSLGLRFDPATFNFLIVGGPNQPVFETVKIGEMTTSLWYKSADAVGAQLDSARDGDGTGTEGNALRGEGGAGIWVQAMTGETDQDSVQSFTVGGATRTFDLGYEQDFEGLQGGVELGSRAVRFGLTGGFGSGDSRFDATGDRVELDVKNVGAYAEFRSGGLWVNGLVKMDWIDLATEPGPGLAARFDARSFGGLLNLGYRAEFGAFFAEPSAGIAWVRTDIDSYQSGGATVDFDDAESLRAQAGLRVGSVFEIGESATLAPYVGLRAFDELADGNTNRFTLGQTIALADDALGTHGRAEAGFSLHAGSVEAFVRGEIDFGGDTEGKGVRAGLRLRF